jgi:hypothetical protein
LELSTLSHTPETLLILSLSSKSGPTFVSVVSFIHRFVPDPPLLQAISPQLIILRVATGKAWSKDTVASVSVLVFDNRAEKRQMNDSGMGLDITLPHADSQGTDLTTIDTPSTKGRAIAV